MLRCVTAKNAISGPVEKLGRLLRGIPSGAAVLASADRGSVADHRCWLGSSGEALQRIRRFSTSKRYSIRRVDYPWKVELEREAWTFMKEEMVQHFETQPARDSTVHIRAVDWPPFTMKEELWEKGRLPALITRHGVQRKVMFNKAEIESIAFDEPQGHLSNLFKGRLFRVHVGEWIEECVVADVSCHPVDQELYFVRLHRHVPGQLMTVPIPVTIAGLWGCPGYQKGGHVDLAMPTIDCECVGGTIPPPFIVDVSDLKLEHPYSKITLADLKHTLPKDGTTRFSRNYTMEEEVIMCYEPRSVPEVPLPPDWEDPNFERQGGIRYHLTYTGFWPKQTTRA
eukprot:TRINITY_DN8577_c0_g2_i1.p1 TRINITY_DN8577_c0_g2~~TRINITY_DN8577_c0_g2_i1.p1  ORF type:complete len:340 (+),score=61.63 TRINITY_DN8577_c0_g2_i1:133-1152(+)